VVQPFENCQDDACKGKRKGVGDLEWSRIIQQPASMPNLLLPDDLAQKLFCSGQPAL
jgi:hypothetical protein